ncbi:zinc finger protein Xfin-like isoform X5 [Maniola jurtina]|uniref:zinc finger protein Xfin-like isoform X5 n=1 Tax=Maniola jurtina TaxID=191418 RepID=UPI001E68F0C0|nr:zinc finger protein Xfin-like isoform X5 [Maniola jurtina]
MRCCVPFCKISAEIVSESEGISLHEFPREVHLRAAWLRALGKQLNLPDSAVVCSQHFLDDDICTMESGSKQIRPGAIPSMVQVCMICLDTRSKLLLMSKYNLDEAYQHLVGQPPCDQGNLKQTLCVQCAQRLVNFSRFRDKSLRACALMMELVEKHESITMQHSDIFNEANNQLKHNIVKTVLKPDHCDLYINHSDTRTQIELDTTVEIVAVKHEEKHGFMAFTLDNVQHMPMACEDIDGDGFNGHSVAYKERLSNSPSTTPSCKANEVELAPIKLEVTLVCKTCMMEFADEDTYIHHTTLHMKENQSSDEYLIPNYCHSSVAAMDENLGTDPQTQLHPTEDTDNMTTNTNEMVAKTIKIEIEVDPRMSDDDSLSNRYLNKDRNMYSGKLDVQKKRNVSNREVVKQPQKHVNRKPIYNYTTNNSNESSNSDEKLKFPCTLCSFRTNTGKKLASHIDAHLKKNDIKIIFGCDHCEYITKTKNDLIKHLTIHADDTTFTCHLCDYKSTKLMLLQSHMRKHSGEKPFSCVFCDFKCGSKSSLKQHRKTHAGERSFSCKFCDYKCSESSFLLKHLRAHTGDRPFSCELCPHKCSRRSDLVRHTKTHSGEKPHSCEVCDYKCMRSSDLRRHMRTHTGEKPFSCDMCQFKCARRCGLAQHRCKYKCSRRSDLARHKRIHTGEKPFMCDVCQFKCAQRSGLVAHIIRNHSM